MTRRYVNQLGEREQVSEVYLVADKQLRANRQGNLYLQLRLTDRTGAITGMLWNVTEAVAAQIESGQYAQVSGATHIHNGQLQVILTRVERKPPETIDPADFAVTASADIERLAARLAELLRSLQNPQLRNLAECYLIDEAFMARFAAAPAGVKNHHAYRGGLLEHVVSLMELCLVTAPRYPIVDRELLLMGAFLHDSGKTDELVYEREFGYSDEGQLIGHVVMAVSQVEGKIREAEQLSGEEFPTELALRLKHMIVSHHGQYEFGSPKLPMTPEAIVLHYLDNLDAKLHVVDQLLKEDPNSESNWTSFHAPLARKFFKGRRT